MGFHTDNADLLAKIERAARQSGRSPEAVIESALDTYIAALAARPPAPVDEATRARRLARWREILAEADALPRIPPDQQPPDLEWDEDGLPR
ncbi:hypothetical protein [Caenispirillum bisanense]|uniref:hypothetical protein n=1 Tax=Caenispirillum bisanense TaxID=414052 RepID=UPI0031DEF2C8